MELRGQVWAPPCRHALKNPALFVMPQLATHYSNKAMAIDNLPLMAFTGSRKQQ